MKNIFDLKHAITNKQYFSEQFSKEKRKEKNIVFVNPQLSNKHLYKMLLPVFWFNFKESNVATAVTGISEYNAESQLFGEGEWEHLTDDMIRWATSIVLPFTVQPLVLDLYARIRNINPYVTIIYNVDFNFYELKEMHPYSYIFKEEAVIDAVEDNMFHADVILVSNFALQDYLFNVFEELMKTKYRNATRKAKEDSLRIEWLQLYIDNLIVLGNVEFDIQESIPSKEMLPEGIENFFDTISKVADEEIKKEAEKKKSTGKVIEMKPYLGKTINEKKLKKAIKKSPVKPTNNGNKKRAKK